MQRVQKWLFMGLVYMSMISFIKCNTVDPIAWVMIPSRSSSNTVIARSNDNFISYSDYSDDHVESKIVTIPANHKGPVREEWHKHNLEQYQPTAIEQFTKVENVLAPIETSVTAKPEVPYFKHVTLEPPTYYTNHMTELNRPIISYKNKEHNENVAKPPDVYHKNSNSAVKVSRLPDLMPPHLMERLVTVKDSVMDAMHKIRLIWNYIWNFFATENNNGAAESRSGHRKKVRVKKQYKKFMLPLLIAYKLKFFTLVPVLISGLILLAGSTGMAGFFFALFAAVISLKHSRH